MSADDQLNAAVHTITTNATSGWIAWTLTLSTAQVIRLTTPISPDGTASANVPANTTISITVKGTGFRPQVFMLNQAHDHSVQLTRDERVDTSPDIDIEGVGITPSYPTFGKLRLSIVGDYRGEPVRMQKAIDAAISTEAGVQFLDRSRIARVQGNHIAEPDFQAPVPVGSVRAMHFYNNYYYVVNNTGGLYRLNPDGTTSLGISEGGGTAVVGIGDRIYTGPLGEDGSRKLHAYSLDLHRLPESFDIAVPDGEVRGMTEHAGIIYMVVPAGGGSYAISRINHSGDSVGNNFALPGTRNIFNDIIYHNGHLHVAEERNARQIVINIETGTRNNDLEHGFNRVSGEQVVPTGLTIAGGMLMVAQLLDRRVFAFGLGPVLFDNWPYRFNDLTLDINEHFIEFVKAESVGTITRLGLPVNGHDELLYVPPQYELGMVSFDHICAIPEATIDEDDIPTPNAIAVEVLRLLNLDAGYVKLKADGAEISRVPTVENLSQAHDGTRTAITNVITDRLTAGRLRNIDAISNIPHDLWDSAIANFDREGTVGQFLHLIRAETRLASRIIAGDYTITDDLFIVSDHEGEVIRWGRRAQTTDSDWSGGRD